MPVYRNQLSGAERPAPRNRPAARRFAEIIIALVHPGPGDEHDSRARAWRPDGNQQASADTITNPCKLDLPEALRRGDAPRLRARNSNKRLAASAIISLGGHRVDQIAKCHLHRRPINIASRRRPAPSWRGIRLRSWARQPLASRGAWASRYKPIM